MSKAESSYGNGPDRSGRDPFTDIFVATRDAWLAGLATIESVSQPSMAGSNSGTGFPGSLLGAIADLANRWRFGEPGGGMTADSTAGRQANVIAADLVLPAGHAMMITANRSVSYWLSLVQVLASHQARAVRAIGIEAIGGGGAGSEHLVARDELRALLREVGDLATREARMWQSELGTLSESLAPPPQQPGLSAPYRRRWRAKA
jgi:hypothetical protein